MFIACDLDFLDSRRKATKSYKYCSSGFSTHLWAEESVCHEGGTAGLLAIGAMADSKGEWIAGRLELNSAAEARAFADIL